MQRRDFLKYSVALGLSSALPLWSRTVFAAQRPADGESGSVDLCRKNGNHLGL